VFQSDFSELKAVAHSSYKLIIFPVSHEFSGVEFVLGNIRVAPSFRITRYIIVDLTSNCLIPLMGCSGEMDCSFADGLQGGHSERSTRETHLFPPHDD
jgi:hypothetical protein